MIQPGDITRAAAALRDGRLVGFPTETVYGLGAAAEDEHAVARLFAVKRRPPEHPVILHGADAGLLERYSATDGHDARTLAEALWPGPLTLVVPRSPRVPDSVTGGQDTVALRVPDHPVALALLERFGRAVAAPSANRFGRVSPTSAAAVRAELGADVDIVLDGGAPQIGIESTVLDLSGATPTILRPGAISAGDLEDLLGAPVGRSATAAPRAPGTLSSHYAPSARVELCAAADVGERVLRLASTGRRVAVLAPGRVAARGATIVVDGLGDDEGYARALYEALRAGDAAGADVVLAVPPSGGGLAEAVRDRLERAAGTPRGSAQSPELGRRSSTPDI